LLRVEILKSNDSSQLLLSPPKLLVKLLRLFRRQYSAKIGPEPLLHRPRISLASLDPLGPKALHLHVSRVYQATQLLRLRIVQIETTLKLA
jgi:hypothetical protein